MEKSPFSIILSKTTSFWLPLHLSQSSQSVDLGQIQFARANSLAGYKSASIPTISKAASIVQYVVAETSLHLDYCSRFGLTQSQVEETEESLACTAYTRFVLDIGMSQDLFALQVAMAPCLLGYQEVALRLVKEGKKDDNIYWEWVESFSGKSYGEAVIRGRELLEDLSQDVGVKRISELVAIFAKAAGVSSPPTSPKRD